MIARIACLLTLLVAPAHAMDEQVMPVEPPTACAPKDWDTIRSWKEWIEHTPPDNAANWAAEAKRIGASKDVWRYHDRLYLALDGGKVFTMPDCPFTDGLRLHVYEGYDPKGGFYLVHTHMYEDYAVALVMRKTGTMYYVPALPVWSPDGTRFAYAHCSVMADAEDVSILRLQGDSLHKEYTAKIPCGLGDCKLEWDTASNLRATCDQAGERGDQRKVARIRRGNMRWEQTISP